MTGKLLGLKPINLTLIKGPSDEDKFTVKRLQLLRDAGEWQELVNLECEARVCWSVVEWVGVCCSALQCVAVRCSALQSVAVLCSGNGKSSST